MLHPTVDSIITRMDADDSAAQLSSSWLKNRRAPWTTGPVGGVSGKVGDEGERRGSGVADALDGVRIYNKAPREYSRKPYVENSTATRSTASINDTDERGEEIRVDRNGVRIHAHEDGVRIYNEYASDYSWKHRVRIYGRVSAAEVPNRDEVTVQHRPDGPGTPVEETLAGRESQPSGHEDRNVDGRNDGVRIYGRTGGVRIYNQDRSQNHNQDGVRIYNQNDGVRIYGQHDQDGVRIYNQDKPQNHNQDGVRIYNQNDGVRIYGANEAGRRHERRARVHRSSDGVRIYGRRDEAGGALDGRGVTTGAGARTRGARVGRNGSRG